MQHWRQSKSLANTRIGTERKFRKLTGLNDEMNPMRTLVSWICWWWFRAFSFGNLWTIRQNWLITNDWDEDCCYNEDAAISATCKMLSPWHHADHISPGKALLEGLLENALLLTFWIYFPRTLLKWILHFWLAVWDKFNSSSALADKLDFKIISNI